MDRGAVPSLFLVLVAVAGLGGCKLEKHLATNDGGGQGQQVVSSSPGGDMDVLVADIWAKQVLPHLQQTATDMAVLGDAIAADLDTAGEAHGYRPSSEGSPWNFAVRVQGTILAAKTDSRAATADVDVTADGKADVILQLGPVIRGTALRDILPFVDFSSFTDQIEFAQLSRSLNTRAYESALKDLPRDALVGKTIDVIGAFTVRGGGPPYLITPVSTKMGGS
ncbi:DUF2291 domain-containing protein [Roseibium sp. AS2]|uniref:DUF2291 family protein n=1 Tax=Roseibium sp. AS2 TaxID=3135781 RepID=UPI003177C1CA